MTPSTPWLSVLIPVYNRADYLAECIDSILFQKIDGVEIIILDDGSTDGSQEIAQSYEERHPKIVSCILSEENCGIAASRNQLLEQSCGGHIWFVDSDDFALPGSLEKIKSAIDGHSPELIICDYFKNTSTYRKSFYGPAGVVSLDREALIRGAFKHRKMYCWQKIIKRDVFSRNPPFPEGQLFEDLYVMPRLLFTVRSYFYIATPCLSYRIHEGSIMAAVSRSRGAFSVEKHNDLADSIGQLSLVKDDVLNMSQDTKFQISNYVAREYIKTAKRYRQRDVDVDIRLSTYKDKFEAASPLSFQQLAQAYLRRGKLILFFKLMIALRA